MPLTPCLIQSWRRINYVALPPKQISRTAFRKPTLRCQGPAPHQRLSAQDESGSILALPIKMFNTCKMRIVLANGLSANVIPSLRKRS